ncbi:hypothetical protein Rhal01_03769 [Rubritalea halochordaticola]|uniref:Uncharacterized protein n=1 Tax=Rubritalea halochordaticola TaxID=714537 RepID=A0ABP9V4H2_9BACT
MCDEQVFYAFARIVDGFSGLVEFCIKMCYVCFSEKKDVRVLTLWFGISYIYGITPLGGTILLKF